MQRVSAEPVIELRIPFGNKLLTPSLATICTWFAPLMSAAAIGVAINNDDGPLASAVWLFSAALLWVIAVRYWRATVVLTDEGVVRQNVWRRRVVPWREIEGIEFGYVVPGPGPGLWAGPALILRDGRRVELHACTGRRTRLRLAGLLISGVDQHSIPSWIERSYQPRWRDLDLPIRDT